jgi:diketogulonate reductase-like aldo/keto reductase
MSNIIFLNKEMPTIGMGTWYMGEGQKPYKEELHALRTGIEGGIQLIDTAEMYGEGLAEKLVGDAISYYEREQLTIVSKVYPWNATKNQTKVSLENSLHRLNTDYLDLYLLHWREDVPLQESIEALMQLQDEGKIKHWGVSNFDVADMKELQQISEDCATNQVLYHLGSRGIEYALKPLMDAQQMPLMAYSPLGHGDTLRTNFAQNKTLNHIAQKHGATIHQVLLAWVISHNNMLAIPKASSERNMRLNLEAALLQLTTDDIVALERAYPAPTSKIPLDEL